MDRYIWLDGEKIYVSEEVYHAYYRPLWRESKQQKIRKDKEYSLNALEDSGFEAIAHDALTEEIVADKLLLDELYTALAELTDNERSLIDALYFKEQTAREYARKIDSNHTGVNRHHKSILEKLQRFLKNYQ